LITPALSKLSDMATEAHTQIQQNCATINPIVGINRGMRDQGIPADAMTIDCLATGKRIILILHDQHADLVRYQFSFKDQDPTDIFDAISLSELTSSTLYDWMKNYFSVTP
tara:strand:+ start:13948 stop:14280 length:333 start_codon:yes stop_codon:yes gene_type:complete